MSNICFMPLRKNVPTPSNGNNWELKKCPKCGRDCWYQRGNAELVRHTLPDVKFLCTECALKATK